MQLTTFMKKSGFKVLAMARLSQCEYSIALYLLNCAVSNLDHIVTTEAELAEAIGYKEEDVGAALKGLIERCMLKIRYKDYNALKNASPSMNLCFEFDVSKWRLTYEANATPNDAVVYPFRRAKGAKVLEVVETEKTGTKKPQTWQRVLDSFSQDRSLDEEELEENAKSARILVETHLVDQVLLILRHFRGRIPTLSLLASNWDHYQELYEQETQKVDFSEARAKHQELNETLKKSCRTWLKRADDLNLSPTEISILKLFIGHRHPRRQLFWAYQARSRYTNLTRFFEENSKLMIAISSSGDILRKPPTR